MDTSAAVDALKNLVTFASLLDQKQIAPYFKLAISCLASIPSDSNQHTELLHTLLRAINELWVSKSAIIKS